MKTLAKNSTAKFNYEILETFEAGLVLLGQEVKSVKNGRISLKASFVSLKDGELWLLNANIPPYQPKNSPKEYDPTRSRKLLMHRKEIKRLIGKIKAKGLTLVPLRVYTKRNRIKLEFALGKGKRQTDKRETIKERDAKRRIERAMKDKR